MSSFKGRSGTPSFLDTVVGPSRPRPLSLIIVTVVSSLVTRLQNVRHGVKEEYFLGFSISDGNRNKMSTPSLSKVINGFYCVDFSPLGPFGFGFEVSI